MKVYTNLNTLAKVTRLFYDLGLKGLLTGDEQEQILVSDFIHKLIIAGKYIEFLQIITRDDKTDFGEIESEEVEQLVDTFFIGISKYVPKSVRNRIGGLLSLITFS